MDPEQLDLFGRLPGRDPSSANSGVEKVAGENPIIHNRDPTREDPGKNNREILRSGLTARQAALAKALREKSINLKFKKQPPPASEP